MYSIQVDRTFQQIIKIFYQIGIWQNDEESNFRKTGKKLFYTFFEVVCINAVVYVKFLYLLFKKHEILAFLNDQFVVHAIENRQEYEQTNEKLKKFVKFIRPYYLALFITVVLLIVTKLPIFSADRGLPFFISFSWNDSEIVYWLAYLFVSLSTLLYDIINLITILIWYMMLNYSIEYELLGNKLHGLGARRETIQPMVKNQKNIELQQRSMFVEDLIVVMKVHQNLKETIERFRSFFSTLFLGQITTSGIVICVSIYSLAFASKENILQTQMHTCTLLYGVFDSFFVMYLANNITVASDRLSYCLFESNWIERTESCKRYVLILGEVLRQPQELIILTYPMNLETFMTIINGAYRMFNILKNFQ
ncbi:odorant receptor 94b-like [Bradysia coprophila]|uniref:odorant receptor 94b-like n=1 Tax=Bradysia coprophila TaxID=38358 RepID=UPI00187DCCFC|nr:odorant receptor 94b-like [Bradysia coprophila]